MSGYLFSNAAKDDLIAIYLYGFLNHGERQAELYQQALKAKCEFLAANPKLYRQREEFTPPVRMYPYKKHLILYIIKDSHILIVRILHARMSLPNHLEY